MKILKPGRQQKGWAKEFTCTGNGNGGGGCGAVLLVEQDDLYQTSSSCYDGSTDHYITFKCSGCGVKTDLGELDALEVPIDIVKKLPPKRNAD